MLTERQQRRVWRCVDAMRQQPANPADIRGRIQALNRNVEAADKLAWLMSCSLFQAFTAAETNEYIAELEDHLGLCSQDASDG